MSHEINRLLTVLEARCATEGCGDLINMAEHHPVAIPLGFGDCHELKAMAEVFGADPAQLASAILKAGLRDLHAELDEDLARMTKEMHVMLAQAGEAGLVRRV